MREEIIIELALKIAELADNEAVGLKATSGELHAALGVAIAKNAFADGVKEERERVASLTTPERGS